MSADPLKRESRADFDRRDAAGRRPLPGGPVLAEDHADGGGIPSRMQKAGRSWGTREVDRRDRGPQRETPHWLCADPAPSETGKVPPRAEWWPAPADQGGSHLADRAPGRTPVRRGLGVSSRPAVKCRPVEGEPSSAAASVGAPEEVPGSRPGGGRDGVAGSRPVEYHDPARGGGLTGDDGPRLFSYILRSASSSA